jgi:hypothetical protein
MLQNFQQAHDDTTRLLQKFHDQSYYQIATKIPTNIIQIILSLSEWFNIVLLLLS